MALGLFAGFYGGVADTVSRMAMDVLWSFSPLLLALAFGTSLALPARPWAAGSTPALA